MLRLSAVLLLVSFPVCAQQQGAPDNGWLAMVARTQSAQPHWMTPVITVTPRLEQEFRQDISRQSQASGSTVTVYGNGKGPDFIPSEHVQVTVGLPSYIVHEQSIPDGWSDLSFTIKYRLLAGNEDHGNYILTAFLGASVPTGSNNNGAGHFTIVPTFAAGKGFGQFDIQSTFAITLPTADTAIVGRPISHNVTLQYHLGSYLWPEFEINSTFWRSGLQAGQAQAFATPGLVIGRIPVKGHLRLAFGAGFQTALTEFHTYNHRLVFTFRLPFN